MRVLLAIDGSPGGFEAVRQIGAVLTSDRDAVTLYCSPPRMPAASNLKQPELQARRAYCEAIFAEAIPRLPSGFAGQVTTMVGGGDTAAGILKAAEDAQAELIGLGARGLGQLQRLLLGSVSRAVAHASKVPVWIAREPVTPEPLNVLVSLANAADGRDLADVLNRLSWPAGTTAHAITVITNLMAGKMPDWIPQRVRGPEIEELVQHWVREHDAEVQKTIVAVQSILDTLTPGLKKGQPIVVEGDPAEEILSAIEREEIDLVVLGTRPRGFVESMMMGSTSEAVLNHANCSVLVVPRSTPH